MKTKLIFLLVLLTGLSPQAQNTSLVGRWPYGPGNAVDSWNHYAMLSLGRSLQIYDFSNPQQTQLTGELFLDDMAFAFAFDNNTAFVGGYKGLYIIDITDVTNPSILSFLPSTYYVRDVEVHNGYLYASGFNGGLGVLDYADPTNPTIAGSVVTNFNKGDIVIENNTLWMASSYDGFSAWELTNPLQPTLLLSSQDYGQITGIEVFGSTLYLASPSQGLMTFDISNLPTIRQLAVYPLTGFSLRLHRDENLLALTNLYHGFSLFDLSNPAAPNSLSVFEANWPNRLVTLNNGIALHCNATGFHVIEVGNAPNMTIKAFFELPDVAQYCKKWDNYLCVNNSMGSLMIMDVSNVQQPHKLMQKYLGLGFIVAYAKDDLLFYNLYSKLFISDMSMPSNPVILDSLYGTTTITHVEKQGNLLFVADYDTLQVLDITDLHDPVRLATYELNSLMDMKVSEGKLVCAENSGFFFIDFSNPQEIIRSERVTNTYTSSIEVKDNLAYLVSDVWPSIADYSLKVFNLTNPNNIQQIGQYIQGKRFDYSVIDGDYLYVQENNIGIHIFDISTSPPLLCGFYPVDIFVSKIAVKDGIIYTPSGWGLDFVANDLITSTGGFFIESNERLKLFPNPAGSSIQFKLDNAYIDKSVQFTILQTNGSEVRQGRLSPGQQQLDVAGLPAGIYVLKLQYNAEIYKRGLFVKQ